MDRRKFITNAAASSTLATPALILPGPASASREEAIVRSFIALSILRRRVSVNYLLVRTATQILGVNLQGEYVETNESRVAVGGIIGGFQAPTIGQVVNDALFAGSIFLNGPILYMISQSEEVDKVIIGMRLALAHGNISWMTNTFRPMNVTGFPVDEAIEQFRKVGEMYLTSSRIAYALIYPVLGKTSGDQF